MSVATEHMPHVWECTVESDGMEDTSRIEWWRLTRNGTRLWPLVELLSFSRRGSAGWTMTVSMAVSARALLSHSFFLLCPLSRQRNTCSILEVMFLFCLHTHTVPSKLGLFHSLAAVHRKTERYPFLWPCTILHDTLNDTYCVTLLRPYLSGVNRQYTIQACIQWADDPRS